MGCFKAASVRPYSMLFKSSFTKEVSPWLSLSVKCPRLVAISVVAPTGSSLLPALRFAPSAVNPSCPTELARLAAPTMAVRSWPLRRSKAKAENAEEGLVPSSFSVLAAVPPDNDAIKPVPIHWFPNPPGNAQDGNRKIDAQQQKRAIPHKSPTNVNKPKTKLHLHCFSMWNVA